MINYLKAYPSQLTQVAEPLKELLRNYTLLYWESKHQEAFEAIKEKLAKTPVLAYFNPKADHVIHVNGSMKDLDAVLQKHIPIIHASRMLTPAETGCLNIKRELLSLVFILKRLHHYVFASRVEVETDDKPLISIWKKSIVVASPQLQCLLLQLVKYDMELTYPKGKDNVTTDVLS